MGSYSLRSVNRYIVTSLKPPSKKYSRTEEMTYHGPVLCRVLSGLGSILLVSTSNTFAADFSSSVSPTEGWKLAADAKDVIIYSRPHADSTLKEFKAIGSIDAPSLRRARSHRRFRELSKVHALHLGMPSHKT